MAKAGLDGDTGRSMHRAMAPVLCPKASAPAGGRATTLRTLALSATAALALAPTSSLAQPMPAPPTGSSTGPARTVAGFFSLYYGYAQDPDFCILSMRSARDAFRRTAALLPDIKGSEGSAFATYFHDVLVPHFAPMAEGVPGLGTYEQLVARRTESMAFLRASAPHGPARTPAEIAAYAEAERGYLTRVAADEAWVEEVFARGPCVRWGARRSSEIPWLGDFGVYRDYWVNEDKVRVRLREERAKHLPQMRGHGIGANLLAHHVAGPWTGASSLGTTLLSVAGAIKAIDDDRDAAATMAVWIAELEPTESAALAQAVAERDRVRAELVAVFDQGVGEMGLPEAATDDPVAAAHLRKLCLGKGALATRVTGQMSRFREQRTEFAGKTFARPVQFAGKTFSFVVVRKGAPWPAWPSGLGAAIGGGLCHVQGFAAVMYQEGVGVKLDQWEVHSDTAYPIPCSRKSATF